MLVCLSACLCFRPLVSLSVCLVDGLVVYLSVLASVRERMRPPISRLAFLSASLYVFLSFGFAVCPSAIQQLFLFGNAQRVFGIGDVHQVSST